MNKFYIQIVLFFLSVSLYLNNRTLATEPDSGIAPKNKSKNSYATSEEIYERNKHLLCTNPNEITNAVKLMNEAVIHLVHHATSKDDYKCVGGNPSYNAFFYKKKHQNHTKVKKITYSYGDPNKYNELINEFWDPNCINLLDNKSAKTKITRVYNPNLVIIQRRYKNWIWGSWKYFYALAKKSQISKDKTVIVMISANINDHHPSTTEYKNTIIENANLFKTDIDSEDDIRKGKFEKKFLNIAGYLIEKNEKRVNITYIRSIDDRGVI
ncbi:fam-a protein [Plasmodium vinckei brucechwatti]|uniref:Fam-a protein n=1 Tax=Plasmodium vinckei brucechwatti TaxID=119398 RepID=A0A6V7S8F2_PLAVN|nr:fam-a protein [Plasmodium vinckei brucechwatti]